MPFDMIMLAMDRSARSYDQDGRLHVAVSHLTKACVNGYHGNEIPGYDQLGLDAYKTYMLLRDPRELERAAPTFNNIPVLDQHIPVTAADERRERVIGSTGTDAAWRAPYLDNSLVFWSDHAIALIESEEMRELSSAYRYVPVMTPGVYQGERYDGVMTQIRANHVALVESGRAGGDVVVMDSKPREKDMRLSPYAAFLAGSTKAYLTPFMAQDQKPPDLKTILMGTTAKNWAVKRQGVEAAIARAVKGKLAQDAEVHIHEHLDGAGAEAPSDDLAPGDPGGVAGAVPGQEEQNGADDDDLAQKVQQLLQGQIDDNDLAIILHALKEVKAPDLGNGGGEGGGGLSNGNGNGNGGSADEDDDDDRKPLGAADEDDVVPKPDTPRMETPAMDKRPVTKVAMDAAINKAVNDAIKKTTARINARNDAERFVRPWVGEIAVAMDSAEDVLKFALEQSGEDVTGIHPSAYKALLSKIPRPGEEHPRVAPIAMDKATNGKYLERFPNANRLRAH
jgi:hypothetical protein